MRAVIVGSGIGGLACAVALRKAGYDAAVYERAPELREVGAGISLWANALRALDYIGAGDAVRAVSQPVTRAQFRLARGKVVFNHDSDRLERAMGLPVTVSIVHRAELVAALASLIPAGAAHYGKAFTGLTQDDSGVTATFADGSTERADLLIGADGLHSAVRAHLHPAAPPRYSGYTCWRGVCRFPFDRLENGFVAEVWGRGARFGITRLPGERVYWWATRNCAPDGREPDEHAFITRTYAHWAFPVPDLIAATDPGSVLRDDILDRPPARPWTRGRVVLVGDAAHATTPNLGQGACMAIEDAPVLARCLRAGRTVPEAFARFESERAERTAAVTRESLSMGALGQWSNPVMCAVRDFGSGLVPSSAAFRSMLKWARHDVGPITAPA